jgi:predicted deacylase
MTEPFEIGMATALPGEIAYGEVPVTHRVDGSPVAIPVILVRGNRSGPTLCVNGGVHGDEFAGMEAIVRIAHDTDPSELRGTLMAVPMASRSRVTVSLHWQFVHNPNCPADLLREIVSNCDNPATVDLARKHRNFK